MKDDAVFLPIEHKHEPLAEDDCTYCGGSGDNDPTGAQGEDPLCPYCKGTGKKGRVPV
jgi:uncharacterized Zn-finger protein